MSQFLPRKKSLTPDITSMTHVQSSQVQDLFIVFTNQVDAPNLRVLGFLRGSAESQAI